MQSTEGGPTSTMARRSRRLALGKVGLRLAAAEASMPSELRAIEFQRRSSGTPFSFQCTGTRLQGCWNAAGIPLDWRNRTGSNSRHQYAAHMTSPSAPSITYDAAHACCTPSTSTCTLLACQQLQAAALPACQGTLALGVSTWLHITVIAYTHVSGPTYCWSCHSAHAASARSSCSLVSPFTKLATFSLAALALEPSLVLRLPLPRETSLLMSCATRCSSAPCFAWLAWRCSALLC